jgi:catechol 2,3-dioxygenase-like lactoylglutathione lyase family enzyme
MSDTFDRAAEDVGNILAMEHVNLTVPDQEMAALFYVTGLGFTRDPYMDFGTFNMWINVGEQQFHLPKSSAQRFRGHIDITVPSLDELKVRLERLGKPLKDTEFGWEIYDDHIGVTCPWGNSLRCFAPDPAIGMALGIHNLEIQIPEGASAEIADFYRVVFATPATANDATAQVSIGRNQTMRFVETDAPIAEYDRHHIAIYVADFSSPHQWLVEHDRITEESDQHQYRFQALTDGTDAALVELEHEVRSLHHPMHARNLVNRNAGQHFFNFRRGREAFVPGA